MSPELRNSHARLVELALSAFQKHSASLEKSLAPLDPHGVADYVNITPSDFVEYKNQSQTQYSSERIASEHIIKLSYGFINIVVHSDQFKGKVGGSIMYSFHLVSFGRWDQLLYRNRLERSMSVDITKSDAKLIGELLRKVKGLEEGIVKWYDTSGKYITNFGLTKSDDVNVYNNWHVNELFRGLEKLRVRLSAAKSVADNNPNSPNDIDVSGMLDSVNALQDSVYNRIRGVGKFDVDIYV